MPKLSIGEMEEFLTTGSKILKLGTVTAGGYPYVNPLWYSYEKHVFLVAGRSKAVWVSHIKKNPKTSLCIDTYVAPYTRVIAETDAEILDAEWTGDWEHWAHRYLGEEEGHQYYEDTKHMPRVLVKLTPRKLTNWAGPGWHPRYQES